MSHSIVAPAVVTPHLDVDGVSVNSLLAEVGRPVALLKMDVEGAELPVLESISEWNALPRQILVEFDSIRQTGRSARRRVEHIDRQLRQLGYRCFNIDDSLNYSFARVGDDE